MNMPRLMKKSEIAKRRKSYKKAQSSGGRMWNHGDSVSALVNNSARELLASGFKPSGHKAGKDEYGHPTFEATFGKGSAKVLLFAYRDTGRSVSLTAEAQLKKLSARTPFFAARLFDAHKQTGKILPALLAIGEKESARSFKSHLAAGVSGAGDVVNALRSAVGGGKPKTVRVKASKGRKSYVRSKGVRK